MEKEFIASLVSVKQIPVIEERLSEIKESFEARAAEARAMVCTEQSRSAVKAMRADLRRDFEELESLRKAVKSKVLEPYNAFEQLYKEYVSEPNRILDGELRDKITAVEDRLKLEKREKLKEYYNELAAVEGVAEYAGFEDSGVVVTLSASDKSLKDAVKRFVERVKSDVQLINTFEDAAELLVEYLENGHNVSAAMMIVNERHRRIREMSGAEAVCVEVPKADEPENVPLPPPVVVDEKQYTVSFKVTATKEKLRELKAYLNDGGYTYE